jgi:hypothetical protein
LQTENALPQIEKSSPSPKAADNSRTEFRAGPGNENVPQNRHRIASKEREDASAAHHEQGGYEDSIL